jgi:hypothetical protein
MPSLWLAWRRHHVRHTIEKRLPSKVYKQLKMSEFISACPKCRQRILCDTAFVGQRVACPVCLQEIIMPEAPQENRTAPPPQGQALPPASPPASSPAGRKLKFPLLAIAGAVVVLVLVAGAVGLTLQKRGAAGPKAAAESDSRTESKNKIAQAVVAQAALLVSQGKLEQADALLAEVKDYPYPASKENADMLRKLGEWHALAGRWQLASARYLSLMEIDTFDPWERVTLDYQACGVALVEAGDQNRYKEFCQSACVSAVVTVNGDAAGRVLKSCLLLPADKAALAAQKPLSLMADGFLATQKTYTDWSVMPMSLWKYRAGEYEQAGLWCRRGLATQDMAPACEAALRGILAMADFQRHRMSEAREELANGRRIIEDKFNAGITKGDNVNGAWYDWIFARILLREAQALIAPSAK